MSRRSGFHGVELGRWRVPALYAAGGRRDTTRPSCTISCSQSSPAIASVLNFTFTFSENVTGFEIGDITAVLNGGAGTGTVGDFVAVSGSVYTANITPSEPGLLTVDVAANVAQDGTGNLNTAAAQYTIMSYVGAVAWNDTFEIANLFQDNLGATPVTGDGDVNGRISDKSGNSSTLSQSDAAKKPIYRVVNGFGISQFDQAGDILDGVNILQKNITVFLYGGGFTTDVFNAVIYQGGNDRCAFISRAGSVQFVQRDSTNLIGASGSATLANYQLLTGKYQETPRTISLNINGVAQVGTTASYTPSVGVNYVQNFKFCERLVFPSVLSAAATAAIETYLIAKRTGIGAGGVLLVTFGDSVTAGQSASAAGNRWANIVASAKGWNLQNSGVSGVSLQNTVQNTVASIGGASAGNMRDNVATRVVNYNPDWVIIMGGLNDLRLNDAAYTDALYANDLGEIVDAIVAGGTPANHIVICSPTYVPAATYAANAPYDGGSAIKHAAYVAQCAAVSTAKGTLYADTYQAMADGGGDALVGGDGIHPNDAGHAVDANTILAVV